jgi:hypothetical protein
LQVGSAVFIGEREREREISKDAAKIIIDRSRKNIYLVGCVEKRSVSKRKVYHSKPKGSVGINTQE